VDITKEIALFNHTLWIPKEIFKAIQEMHVKAGKFVV
jgi:hypothetical protein